MRDFMDFEYEHDARMCSSTSLFEDDDFLGSQTWSPAASPPRRCDRGSTHGSSFSMDYEVARVTSFARSREELFFYCTEELGSESTSGVAGHPFITPISCSVQAAPTFYTPAVNSPTPEGIYLAPPTLSACYPSCNKQQFCSYGGRAMDCCSPPNPQAAYATSTPASSRSAIAVASPSFSKTSLQRENDALRHDHHCHHRLSGNCGHATTTFPPPLSSLLCDRPLMRSFKSHGQFVLKKVANVSRRLFRSTRKDGRLRLDLLSFPVDDQSSPLFPANPAYLPPHNYFLNPSVPSFKLNFSNLLCPKPTLISYESLCPQALAMVMHPNKSTRSSLVQKPQAPPLSSPPAHINAKCRSDADPTPSTHPMLRKPHFFALLSLFPVGLGLIIFEFGQSKCGDFITLQGVYILKSLRFESICGSRDVTSNVSRHQFFPTLCGMNGEVPKGNAIPF